MDMVTGMRCDSVLVTVSAPNHELPRSPRTALPAQRKYWVTTGSLRPRSSLYLATCSWVALTPSFVRPTLPAPTIKRMNATVEITAISTTPDASRLATYFNTADPLRDRWARGGSPRWCGDRADPVPTPLSVDHACGTKFHRYGTALPVWVWTSLPASVVNAVPLR